MDFGAPKMDEDLLFRLLFIAIYTAFFGVRIRYRVESARREPEQRYKAHGMAIKILIIAILGYIASIVLYMLAPPWTSWSQMAMRALACLKIIHSTE